MARLGVATLVMASLLTGCFLIPSNDKKNEPWIDGEDSEVFVTQSTPFEIIVFVDHSKGPEAVETGELTTASGQVITTLARVRDDRWVGEVTWQDVQSVTDIEVSRNGTMSVDAFLDFTTKWDVTASQQIRIEVACDGGGETCEPNICADLSSDPDNCGECGNTCESCTQGVCLRQSLCISGGSDGQEINGDRMCRESGYEDCLPSPIGGVDDAIFVIYNGAGCSGAPIEFARESAGTTCGESLIINPGYSATAMCVD